jgi:hypothetical protein
MTHIENGGRGLTRMHADTIKGRGLALKHRQITELIIGVFFDVYNDLGFGYLESVYRQAMAIALRDAGLSARRNFGPKPRFRRFVFDPSRIGTIRVHLR